jgi:mRNA-degrading endonuclease RelE of RelBE toxin-antitoxin system
MKLHYTHTAQASLNNLPSSIRKAFYKQARFLLRDLRHPSLRAKKFNEADT